ncbi:hypothetical protein DXG03_007249 [Asterophora parasitica]|uniref:Phosphoinositide phospholipase C n=1 Tax=Asterophora parasitica TaxID=117018 RepID=A0A9P7K945_9AGAR|nr:hypothetical protein DXG03_007249 [Asterophora parasitica]
MWDKTLRGLHAIRQELMSGLGNIEMRQAIWEKHYWRGAGEEKDQKLAFEEVEKLCRRLNINSSSEALLRLFKQADTLHRNFLDFDDFRRFVKLLKGRPEIDRLYKKLCAAGVFDITVFESFMREEQKSSLSPSELQAVFERYSEPLSATQTRAMTLETFTTFLLSPDNSAFLDQHGRVWHDMTRPLSDYYVSSSHNTYLVGHQLVGESTIEGYIRALLHSCRSVELDIYDGEQPSEPQIFHGKTLTSKVSLREVCHAIWKYGFVTSPYPIIISAEVHCSLAGQDAIARIMKEVFKGALVQEPHPGVIEKLPSPEELKGRILFKTKNLNLLGRRKSSSSSSGIVGDEYELTDTSVSASSSTSDSNVIFEQGRSKRHGRRRESDSSTVKELKDDFLKVGSHVLQHVRRAKAAPKALQQPRPVAASPRTAASLPGSSAPSSSLFGSLSSSPAPLYTGPAYPQAPILLTPRSALSPEPLHTPPSSAAKPRMSPALLSLLVYTVGVKCRGINKKEFYAPEHMFSLSETTANRMLKNAGGITDLIKHCRTRLVRVYPKGTRIGSTNFDPHRFWSAGAQLVAINWQTFDLGYMINRAMFQRNGRAGYVLKPPVLLAPGPGPPPGIATPTTNTGGPKDLLAKRTKHVCDVTIVSAQQLPPPRDASSSSSGLGAVDPLVEVSLHVPEWPGAGLTAIAVPARTVSVRTGLVKGNGFNPVWEERLKIPFDVVGEMRELVFVRFAVRSGEREDADPLAVYCASLGSLGMGYRHLPLHDMQLSQYLFSTLFNERNRSVTFLKRKNGLFKKAHELGVLCSVDVAVIIFGASWLSFRHSPGQYRQGSLADGYCYFYLDERHGHDSKLFQYCSTDIRDVVQRHLRHTGERDTRGPADFSDAGAKNDNAGDGDDDEDADGEDVIVPSTKKGSSSARLGDDDEFKPSARVITDATKNRQSVSHGRSRQDLPPSVFPPVPQYDHQHPVSSDRHHHQRPYEDLTSNKKPRLDYALSLNTHMPRHSEHAHPLSAASSEDSIQRRAEDAMYMYQSQSQTYHHQPAPPQRIHSEPVHRSSHPHHTQYPAPYYEPPASNHHQPQGGYPFPGPPSDFAGWGRQPHAGGNSPFPTTFTAPPSYEHHVNGNARAASDKGSTTSSNNPARDSFARTFLEADQQRKIIALPQGGMPPRGATTTASFGLDWPTHAPRTPAPNAANSKNGMNAGPGDAGAGQGGAMSQDGGDTGNGNGPGPGNGEDGTDPGDVGNWLELLGGAPSGPDRSVSVEGLV